MLTFFGILLFVIGVVALFGAVSAEGLEAPQETDFSNLLFGLGIVCLCVSGGIGLGEILVGKFL